MLSGVTQERRGDLGVEDYYQPLINPQALQLDSRQEDLDLLFFSDYDTGYIYSVSGCKKRCLPAAAVAAAIDLREDPNNSNDGWRPCRLMTVAGSGSPVPAVQCPKRFGSVQP